jgi:hypothetical protein
MSKLSGKTVCNGSDCAITLTNKREQRMPAKLHGFILIKKEIS